MKINIELWEKFKKTTLFYAWPSAIAGVLMVFVTPVVVAASPALALLLPWLSVLIFAPFAYVDVQRRKQEAARQKRALQDKHDAEDKATFGKPLRELEL